MVQIAVAVPPRIVAVVVDIAAVIAAAVVVAAGRTRTVAVQPVPESNPNLNFRATKPAAAAPTCKRRNFFRVVARIARAMICRPKMTLAPPGRSSWATWTAR